MGASGPREQQEWAEPVGGTDIWQGRGVPGLESVGIEGVGQGKGVRQCAVGGVGSVLREGGYGVL